jgi:hypothetical protein
LCFPWRQARFQEFLTFYRILALTTMFVTLGIKLHADWDIVPERIEIIGMHGRICICPSHCVYTSQAVFISVLKRTALCM